MSLMVQGGIALLVIVFFVIYLVRRKQGKVEGKPKTVLILGIFFLIMGISNELTYMRFAGFFMIIIGMVLKYYNEKK